MKPIQARFRPMVLSMKFDTAKTGQFIVHIDGSQVIISKKHVFHFSKPNEIPHYAAFHLGLHFLPKYSFSGFQYPKG